MVTSWPCQCWSELSVFLPKHSWRSLPQLWGVTWSTDPNLTKVQNWIINWWSGIQMIWVQMFGKSQLSNLHASQQKFQLHAFGLWPNLISLWRESEWPISPQFSTATAASTFQTFPFAPLPCDSSVSSCFSMQSFIPLLMNDGSFSRIFVSALHIVVGITKFEILSVPGVDS